MFPNLPGLDLCADLHEAVLLFSGPELNIICRNQFGQTELAEEHKGCTSFIAGIKGADTMLLHLFIPFQNPPHQTKNHLLSNKTVFFPKYQPVLLTLFYSVQLLSIHFHQSS